MDCVSIKTVEPALYPRKLNKKELTGGLAGLGPAGWPFLLDEIGLGLDATLDFHLEGSLQAWLREWRTGVHRV